MKRIANRKLNIHKAARFAIAINAAQIIAVILAIVYVCVTGQTGDRQVELGVLFLAFVIIASGAALDIREAISAERTAEQASMLEEAYGQLESLNNLLRKQRHDFLNHWQVVFSLMEMREYSEAMHYIESVYGDMREAGSSLKTALPAINALIAAKRTDCQERGIAFCLDIRSGWQEMPIPGWEMCRVLGKLIDNARDALTDSDTQQPQITLEIDEGEDAYSFRVSNNGPAIPQKHMEAIFTTGFTTKRNGHGFGLAIVREILEAYRGNITVSSTEDATVFVGSIPRAAKAEKGLPQNP